MLPAHSSTCTGWHDLQFWGSRRAARSACTSGSRFSHAPSSRNAAAVTEASRVMSEREHTPAAARNEVCSRLAMTRARFIGGSVVALALLAPATGQANGAFPDTSAILLPRDHPDTIILGTNFGLVTTSDGGHTWRWACEHDESVNGAAYQMTPASRVLTLGSAGLAYTDDLGCTWHAAPKQDETLAYDYFPDPTDAQRILISAVVVN